MARYSVVVLQTNIRTGEMYLSNAIVRASNDIESIDAMMESEKIKTAKELGFDVVLHKRALEIEETK